jgi:signal transduction histidine kinase
MCPLEPTYVPTRAYICAHSAGGHALLREGWRAHTRRMATDRAPAAEVADLWGDTGTLRPSQVLVDICAGAAFAAVIGLVQLQLSPWSSVVALLLGAALAVRRRLPMCMVVLAVAASVLQVVTGDLAVVADAAYIALFSTLGSHRVQRVRRLGLVCAAVAVVVAGSWAGARASDSESVRGAVFVGIAFAAITAVVVGGGWVGGFLRWQRRQAVQARADAVLEAAELRRLRDLYEQEQERGRIAADMHDLVAHSWAIVAAQADGARYVLRADPDQATEALRVIADTARSAMGDVRVLLAQLRDRSERRQQSDGSLEFEQTDALIARMRASGMDVRFERHGLPAPSDLLTMATARVLAESLTNALKHGDLSWPVHVEEDWRDGYRLRVANATCGPPTAESAGPEPGHGLLGMAERMKLVGGALRAGRDGDQWVVEAAVAQTRLLDGVKVDIW